MENIVYNEVSETNREKKQVVIDRKYKFNFSYIKRLITQSYIDVPIIKLITNVNLSLF